MSVFPKIRGGLIGTDKLVCEYGYGDNTCCAQACWIGYAKDYPYPMASCRKHGRFMFTQKPSDIPDGITTWTEWIKL